MTRPWKYNASIKKMNWISGYWISKEMVSRFSALKYHRKQPFKLFFFFFSSNFIGMRQNKLKKDKPTRIYGFECTTRDI